MKRFVIVLVSALLVLAPLWRAEAQDYFENRPAPTPAAVHNVQAVLALWHELSRCSADPSFQTMGFSPATTPCRGWQSRVQALSNDLPGGRAAMESGFDCLAGDLMQMGLSKLSPDDPNDRELIQTFSRHFRACETRLAHWRASGETPQAPAAPSSPPQVANSGAQGTIIGRWCDVMLPSVPRAQGAVVLVIIRDANGRYRLLLQGPSGPGTSNSLVDRGGQTFAEADSPSGDYFQIRDGILRMLDEDGYIRSATPISNRAQCFN